MFLFLTQIRKNRCDSYTKRRLCVLSNISIMAISVGLPVAVNNSVPASQVGFQPRADPASEARGGRFQQYQVVKSHNSFVTVREMKAYFTTLLWQNIGRQNSLISHMLFSELYKMMEKKLLS